MKIPSTKKLYEIVSESFWQLWQIQKIKKRLDGLYTAAAGWRHTHQLHRLSIQIQLWNNPKMYSETWTEKLILTLPCFASRRGPQVRHQCLAGAGLPDNNSGFQK